MAEFTLFNSTPELKTCSKCGFPAAKFRAKRNLCMKCHAEYHAQHYRKNKTRYRDNARRDHLRAKYGLTLEQYDDLHKSQNGRCAICQSDRKLNVDHCHKTGVVRGLLCWPCNTSLGKFNEDAAMLEAAARYIRKAENDKGISAGS
jgi:hypothetical protein